MTDDDWAPLPADRLCQRPGESADVQPRVVVPAPPVAAPAQSPAEVREAELALAALRARLAQAPPATSLVALVQHREQHRERRERAAHRPELAALVPPAVAEPAAAAIEYDAGHDGRDPREDEPWYAQLPAAEQQRLHEVWAGKREHMVDATSIQRRIGNRRLVAAIVAFAASAMLGTGALWHATIGAGVVCGLWWRHTGPDRFLDPLRAIACFFALQSLAMLLYGTQPQLFMDAIFVVSFASLVGFDGEIRRSGGFGAD